MGREVLTIAVKDVRLLMRDKGGAFATFIFPLIYCIFFGVIFAARFGGTSAMGIALVMSLFINAINLGLLPLQFGLLEAVFVAIEFPIAMLAGAAV